MGARYDETGYHYAHVDVALERDRRLATITVSGPSGPQPTTIAAIEAAGAAWWPLAMARELDDAILMLRTNELEIGTLLLKTKGDAAAVLVGDAAMFAHQDHWFVCEVIGLLRRTLSRLDVSSRSLFAVVDQGSCFAGTLAELLFAADRGFMLHLQDGANDAPKIALGVANFGPFPMAHGWTRLAARFNQAEAPSPLRGLIDQPLDAAAALDHGLVTFAPDDLDWDEEIRVAIEERTSLSPDALTGMEANLRFGPRETPDSRVFGRLSAWQNWIFNRPNAVGEQGALKLFGSGTRPGFDWKRV